MRKIAPSWQLRISVLISGLLIHQALLAIVFQPAITRGQAQAYISYPRVNVPNLSGNPFTPAIFWLGKIDPYSNYADVRLYYYAEEIQFVVHIIDRRLWYDETPSAPELSEWDSVSLYLNLDGNIGTVPTPNSYRFEIQLDSNYQASYRGDGADWIPASLPITSYTEWRGLSGPNSDEDSEGWVAYFQIPFPTLGLGGPPSQEAQWGLALELHDRDDPGGQYRQHTPWPEAFNPNIPSTWGQISFDQSVYEPPAAIRTGEMLIRNGLNGNTVADAAVGGHTTCGNDGYEKWTLWGEANYAGFNQMNIQNQWDVADWPCFSKFYITFPLGSIPPGRSILSASLSMDLFGTSGGGPYGDPPDSYIQALIIDEDWDEATITWNNAPPASESLSGTWVPPVPGTYHWDVSRAVHQAYASGEPLRLVLYSIDGERHSGKYFYTSDSTDWGGEIRPTLRIEYGIPCDSPNLTCSYHYLPITVQK